MAKSNLFYIKSYFDFNFLDYAAADKFAEDIKNKIESNKKWKYEKLYIVALGAGLGNYLVPVIFNISNKLNINIEVFNFDKDDLFLNVTKFLYEKIFEIGEKFWQKENVITELGLNFNEKNYNKYDFDYNEKEFNNKKTLVCKFENVDLDSCVKESFNSFNKIKRVDILYSCYFFYHVKYPLKIFDIISKKLSNTALIVSGNAAGDWLLHDGIFDNYLLGENENINIKDDVKLDKKIKFWKEFWDKLSDQRRYIRNLDAISNSFIHALTNRYPKFKIIKIATQTSSNKILIDKDYLANWIFNESTSIFEELKLSSEIINDIISSLKSNHITMDFQNSLVLYSIEREKYVYDDTFKNIASYLKINYQIDHEKDIYNYLCHIIKQLIKYDLLSAKICGGFCVPYLNSKNKKGGWSDYFVAFINPYLKNYEKSSKTILKVLLYLWGQKQKELKLTNFLFQDVIGEMQHPFYVKFSKKVSKYNLAKDIILIEQNHNNLFENTSCYRFKISFSKNFDEYNEIEDVIANCDNLLKLLISDIETNLGIISSSTLKTIKECVSTNNLFIDEIVNKVFTQIKYKNLIHIRHINIKISHILKVRIEKYIRNLIALNITHEFETFYALPIEFYFKGRNNGSFILWLFLNDLENENEFENYILDELKPFMSLVASQIAIWDFNELQRRILIEHSIKSAVAAIMSRNGSHNIGSHILSSVGNNYNELPDDQILYKYIQDRMDYIAQITTEFPTWSYPVWFVRDLMRNFYIQHHLQNYIARSEGLSAFHWKEDKNQQFGIVIKIKRAGKEEFIIAPHSNNTSFEDDIAVAIPGGVVGNQAFYTILENIIRNSAKHIWAGQSQADKDKFKNLEITIEIDEKSERDFVIFKIWDNITNIFDDKPIAEGNNGLKRLPIESGNEKLISEDASGYLHWLMNSKLSKSFIDQSTGQLIKANWGLAEMKISAGFLSKKDTSIIGSNEIQDILFEYTDQGYSGIISAVPIQEKIKSNGEKSEESYRYHLGYQFAIPKPKEVLIYGQLPDIANKDEYRKHSIYFQEGDSEKNIDYEFVVLMDNGTNEFVNRIKRYVTTPTENKDELYLEIKSEIERYPFRLFIASDELAQQLIPSNNPETQFLAKRIIPLTEAHFKEKLTNNQQDFKLYLYAEWIRHLKQMRGLGDSQLKMLINLKGGNKHNNKQRIFRLIFDKFKTEMIDDLGGDDEIKKLLGSITTEDLDRYDEERREHKFKATYSNMDSLIDSWVRLVIYEFKIDPSGRFDFDEQENDFKFILKVSEELAHRVIDAGEQLKEIAKKYYAIVKKVYIRYEEDTPTLPPIYRADSAGEAEINLDEEINEIVKLIITNNEYQEHFDIAYNRHIPVSAAVYSESLSGAQTYFSILNHLPNDPYLKQKIALQLVENALLRLIVIDERVAQYLTNFQYAMKEKYRTANIEIPVRVKPLEGDSESIDLIQNAEKSEPVLDLENIADNKYDMMVIHQGILDKLYKNATKKQLSEFLNKVKERVPFIIITSGRGEPENIPDDAKFLAFSNIETFLLKDHPEKFLLSQIAMKITSIKRQ